MVARTILFKIIYNHKKSNSTQLKPLIGKFIKKIAKNLIVFWFAQLDGR